jgi:hypothetical protein
VVYLADGFNGVHYSTDGGNSWSDLNEGLTHRTAMTLGISDNGAVLYAGIEGAGVYRLGTPPTVDSELLVTLDTPESQKEGEEAPQGEDKEPPPKDQPKEQEENAEGLDLEEQSKTFCPASFVPLVLAIGLIWNERKKFGPLV